MVIYVNDPDITTTVSDLNVRFVGEMSLRDKKLAVTGKDKIPELSVVVISGSFTYITINHTITARKTESITVFSF